MLFSYVENENVNNLDSVKRTRISLIMGFASIIGIMAALFIFRSFELQTTKEHIDQIAQNHLTKINLVINMRSAAQERTQTLQRMLLQSDPFVRDQEWIHFNQLGAEFARSRLQILAMELTDNEKVLLDYQGDATKNALEVQRRVVELIESDKLVQAREVLLKSVIPAKDQVISQLNTFYHYQEEQAENVAQETTKIYEEMRTLVLAVSIISCLFAIVIAVVVIRRATKTEKVLSSAYSDIQKQSEEKSLFLSEVIDEYRVPLNSLLQYSDAIAKNAAINGNDNKKFLSDVTKLQNACYHLNGLTAEILDISKVESGKITLLSKDFNVNDLVKDVVNQIQIIAEKNNNRIELQCDEDFGLLRSDPNKIRQILFNLLANACKYTEFGIITLSVKKVSGFEDNAEKWISFSVIDTGIGIPPEKVGTIFSATSRPWKSKINRHDDSGLSLAISRRLCHMMGGEITVNSETGMGSVFTIRLPVKPATEASVV